MGNRFTAGQSWTGAGMLPPAGYAPAGEQPARGGAAVAFKWGVIFGAVAGVVNLIQIFLGVLSVNANLAGISLFESSPDFTQYIQCSTSGNQSNCAPLSGTTPGVDSISAVLAAFYGTCFVAFVLTLVIYLFAGRAAARDSRRRGIGVAAAVIAAAVGSLVYLVGSIVALTTTGRTGLFFGMGPFGGVSSEAWTAALLRATIIADLIGMLVAMGLGALMGLWGAALGMRGVLPPGYPVGTAYPPAGVATYPGYPNYPVPAMPPYPGAPQTPTASPPYAPPPSTPYMAQPGYPMPAQYPPLPSHYEPQPAAPSPASDPDNRSDTPTLPADPATGGPA